jgi:hypothetical protein
MKGFVMTRQTAKADEKTVQKLEKAVAQQGRPIAQAQLIRKLTIERDYFKKAFFKLKEQME